MSLHFVSAHKGSRWQAGQSGNPKGGQRDRTLQELCRAHTAEAVHSLIVMMRTKSPNQLPATLAILDRGWGKPTQRIEGDGTSSFQLHLLAALSVEPALEQPRQAEPQQPLTIDGSVPTE